MRDASAHEGAVRLQVRRQRRHRGVPHSRHRRPVQQVLPRLLQNRIRSHAALPRSMIAHGRRPWNLALRFDGIHQQPRGNWLTQATAVHATCPAHLRLHAARVVTLRILVNTHSSTSTAGPRSRLQLCRRLGARQGPWLVRRWPRVCAVRGCVRGQAW